MSIIPLKRRRGYAPGRPSPLRGRRFTPRGCQFFNPKPYSGPVWIGKAISPTPLPVGRAWIGKAC